MSNSKRFDLAVAYRIYPGVSRAKPPIYADDKLKLARMCLRSFKLGLGSLKVKVWAILDTCPPEYEELFTSLFAAEDLVLVRCPKAGNCATFAKQIEILTTQDDADLVYLGEDDYVYHPGAFHKVVDFMRHHPDADFCSPYDHPDFYKHDFHLHKQRIKVEQGQVWKTQNGTVCSFMTRKTTLIETKPTLMSYAKNNTDAGMWLSLTKQHVLNPWTLLTQPFIFPFRGYSLACAWLFNWRQHLFGRRYTLWIPVPSIGTHMVDGLLAEHEDWQKEFDRCDPNKPFAQERPA